MTKSICLYCMLLLFLRTAWTNKYPSCKHGGVRMDINGRTLCHCPHNRTNTGPLCEMVRVNFENLQDPLVFVSDRSLSLPLHLSLEFISRDFHGTGVLFTLGDYKKGMILELALKYGQPVIGLNDRRQQSTVVSLHDNAWHHLDVFLTKTATSIEIVLIVDRCVMRRGCSQKLIFDGIIPGVQVSGPLTLGMKSTEKHRLHELCLDSIVINSQLVDLSEATIRRPLARGCPKCEEACFLGAAGRCGVGGVCQNPIVAATDQYVCTCRPGFQPALNSNLLNTNVINSSAPCVEPASEWEIKRAFSINVRSKSGFTVLFSIRTRQMVTTIMRSRDGGLRLRIVDGHLEFHLYTESLMLPAIDVADGKWHTIRLTLTPFLEESTSRMAELSVDGLWDSFYNSTLLQTDLITESNLDGSLTIEAISSCLSDLRRETLDIRNKIFQDYLIVGSTKERQGFLQSGCKTYDPCTTFSPCGPNEVCSPEWRGYKCTCKPGFSRRIIQQSSAAHCVLTTCDPNPCKNGGECFVLANETATWGNDTVGVFCDCHGGWNGLFCEKPPLARPSLQNWWLIPFFFVLILILFWIIFYVCWWKRHRVKNTISNVPVGPHFVEEQEKMSTESAVKAGEEDYRGSLDLAVLKVPEAFFRPSCLTERGTSVETRTTDLILSAEGERFLTMDQPLQYAFEGYDSSPSPTYFLTSNGSGNARGHYNFFTHAP